jgi:hypothetical protein
MTKSAKPLPSLYEALDRLDEAFRDLPREDVRAYRHDQRSHPEVALHFTERNALVEELRDIRTSRTLRQTCATRLAKRSVET